jgi:hypothetical protein
MVAGGPEIDAALGAPPPSLKPTGSASYNAHALSYRSFRLQRGLLLKADASVSATEMFNNFWMGFCTLTEIDSRTGLEEMVAGFFYGSSDEPVDILFQGESIGTLPNDYVLSWHTYEVRLTQDMYIEYYVDDEFILRSPGRVFGTEVRILLGGRSVLAQSRLDNVIVDKLPPPVPGRIVFTESFDDDLSQWYVAGGPEIDCSLGNPAPSLKPTGSASYNAHLLSKQSFRLERGLDLRVDASVSATEMFNNFWMGLCTLTEIDSMTGLEEMVAGFFYGSSDEPVDILFQGESIGTLPNDYVLSWHTYEVRLTSDMYVDYCVDGQPILTSPHSVDEAEVRILLGGRSVLAQSRLDNVQLTRGYRMARPCTF